MTDPEAQRATDDARRALESMITPYIAEDTAADIARKFMAGLLDRRWRPPLHRPDYSHGRRPEPGAHVRGAEAARQALERRPR
ncbi:MAG: hypothetical protein ACRDT8_00155 [Micromonosporaceae bacterium]